MLSSSSPSSGGARDGKARARSPVLLAPEPSPSRKMLDSTKRRLRQHSKTVAITVGVAGGLYLAGQYAVERVRDMQDKAADERRARERSVSSSHHLSEGDREIER